MKDIKELLVIMRSLRDKNNGCGWDLAQTHRSLTNYVLEEAYEVVAAVEAADPVELCDELGDLLFQIVFHAELAAEQEQFDFGDVVAAICHKMTQRHPHVFAAAAASHQQDISLQEHDHNWEVLKQKQRESSQQRSVALMAEEADSHNKSVLDGVAGTLPAITTAMKLQKRAASVGFDWKSIAPIYEKVLEELQELRQEVEQRNQDGCEDELGDLLFTVINLSRHAGVEPESALRRANQKFSRRFRLVEHITKDQGVSLPSMTSSQLEKIWQDVKRQESS